MQVEELEDSWQILKRHHDVAAIGIFNVGVSHLQFFHLGNPATRVFGLHKPVLSALDDDYRDILDFLHSSGFR